MKTTYNVDGMPVSADLEYVVSLRFVRLGDGSTHWVASLYKERTEERGEATRTERSEAFVYRAVRPERSRALDACLNGYVGERDGTTITLHETERRGLPYFVDEGVSFIIHVEEPTSNQRRGDVPSCDCGEACDPTLHVSMCRGCFESCKEVV